MKARISVLGLILLSALVFNNCLAQKASISANNGLTIGFGGGTSYQKSDLVNSRGWGVDFTIGSPIYRKENAFLSVDWKFRFLAGVNKAYDHRINTDNTYSNIRYNFFNYDLELELTLNRLRERTGIVLTGFAGAGITHGRTFTDLYDAGNNLYDFSGIDPNRDKKLVYDDLVALSDGDFETDLVSKAALLPTVGIFAGYQISRSITIGVEYKTNFYLTEENGFVGIDLDNRVLTGSGIDRNNYVTLGLRWALRGGASRNFASGTGNQFVAGSLPPPSVLITDPAADPYHTGSPTHTIRASITNVSGAENISFFQNGFPNNSFTYNVNTKILVANVRLREGENNIRITASNGTSTAEDRVMITLGQSQSEAIPPPTAEFTSPSGTRAYSASERIDVTASVKNVSDKKGIQLTVNGRNTPFDFYPVSASVKFSVILHEGDNNLFIRGTNASGTAYDQLTVSYSHQEEVALPAVRFTNPLHSVEVTDNRFPVRAITQNVRSRNDVTVRFNGYPTSNFSFSTDGTVSLNLFLAKGMNTVEIEAENDAGYATDATSITYIEPVYIEPVYVDPIYQDPGNNDPGNHNPVIRSSPPVIRIIRPGTNPFRTGEQAEELHATILNVNSKENITLSMNGTSTRDFSFNRNTNTLIARVALREGRNIVAIQAQNESGSDMKEQVLVKGSAPCELPAIRLIDPRQESISTNRQSYPLRAEIRNITDMNQVRLIVNGNPGTVHFSNTSLSTTIPLVDGLNTIMVIARNECGEDRATARITYTPEVVEEPCTPPRVAFTVTEVNRPDATHELRGSVTGVQNKTGIALTLDGRANNGFQFVPSTGELSARFKLTPGSHTITVKGNNDCGTDTESKNVTIADEKEEPEEACGIRINPGNSDWQFCLITPSGRFSRDNLTNSNFSYSGPASSLYFMPIGGGGNAMVNGRPYTVRSGQYYLFTGSLNVTVSTKNPGAMGQWSVCITANRAPASGNGNNRPTSPCEGENNNTMERGNRNRR